MSSSNFTTTLVLDQTPEVVFDIINQVDRWWTQNLLGSSHQLNDEFTVVFSDIHVSTQKVVEFVPGQKIVWLVTGSRLNHFANKAEWTGTTIHFEIAQQGDTTQLQFTHEGLVPEVECYQSCTNGWRHYIDGSLCKLLTCGTGNPASKQ